MQQTMLYPLVLVAGLLAAGSAAASETYTYTGNNFNTFVTSTGASQAYNTSEHITFQFTVGSALAANTSLNTVSNYGTIPAISSWSFSDGLQTITNLNDPQFQYFHLSTNASGAIASWEIAMLPVNAQNHYMMGMLISPNVGISGVVPGNLSCSAGVSLCGNVQDYAFTGNASYAFAGSHLEGSWAAAPTGVAAVPEAETWALWLAGLGALSLLNRRRMLTAAV